jgi:hypothetical protein
MLRTTARDPDRAQHSSRARGSGYPRFRRESGFPPPRRGLQQPRHTRPATPRRALDHETHRLRGGAEPLVLGTALARPAAVHEQLGRRAVIETVRITRQLAQAIAGRVVLYPCIALRQCEPKVHNRARGRRAKFGSTALDRDDYSSNRHHALTSSWSMIFSDLASPAGAPTQLTEPCMGFAQAGNRCSLLWIILSFWAKLPRSEVSATYADFFQDRARFSWQDQRCAEPPVR